MRCVTLAWKSKRWPETVMARETANKRDGQSRIETIGEIWSATETRSDRDGQRENERDGQRENERDGQREIVRREWTRQK